MNNKIVLIVISFLVVGGSIFFWPNDENKIRKNLASLADYCSSQKEESVIETLQRAALAAKLCTTPCSVRIESFKIDHEFSKKELTDHLLMMKKKLPETVFSFHDTVIDIAGSNKAHVITTLRINGKIGDEQFTDAYEIGITTEKENGSWLFSSFTVDEFMKK